LTQLGQYLGGYRNLGEKTARKIEQGAKKPQGWLDATDQSNVQLSNLGARKIPLIDYVQAGAMKEITQQNQLCSNEDFLITDLEISTSAFALEIKGDSMLPEFKPGDKIIIDPEISPRPGDFVVAKNGSNEATFKKYRPRGIGNGGNEIFELVPLNNDYATIHSDREKVIIIGTMVEHRKYRK
jgi:SOS-response transcriptional repressor LexA